MRATKNEILEGRLAAQKAATAFYKNLLLEANEICRSVFQISLRNGKDTNWVALTQLVQAALEQQHKALFPRAGADGENVQRPNCNHWPGQPRCEVCGMGMEKHSG